MEAEQPAREELNFFHKDDVRFKTLKDISKSISDLYVSIKDNYIEFNRRHDSQDVLRDPRQAVEKLIACNKAEARKAETLVARLHSEMQRICETESAPSEKAPSEGEEEEMKVVGSYDMREDVGRYSMEWAEMVGSYDMREDMERYSRKWAEALWIVEKIFAIFAAKGEQMQKYWKGVERSAFLEGLVDGTQQGTDLFHEILAERLQKFGIEEVEDVLDQFLASKECEVEAEKARKDPEGSKVLDIAREEIRKVFDALRKEMEELREESEELKEELEWLKRCQRH